MARTSFLDFDTATEEKYFGILSPLDRFVIPRVGRKIQPRSMRRRKGVSQRSLLPQCGVLWAGLTQGERDAWNAAGVYTSLTGWKLFVKDQVYRIVNEISGIATPSNQYQALVGQLHCEGAAPDLKIFQPHPNEYFISQKVGGKKGMYVPVVVTEHMILPLTIGLSYFSDLTVTAGDGFAKMYAVVRRLYQGRNIDEVLEIVIDLQSDWQTVTATLSYILGDYTSYALYFHLYHVTGDLFFDNVKAVHNSQNWVRDAQCNDINADFTRAFYQVPKNWAAIEVTAGCFFESIYY